MNNSQLAKRINGLSEKLRDTTSGSILRLDFNSFSDAEKLLFHKVDEIEEKLKAPRFTTGAFSDD